MQLLRCRYRGGGTGPADLAYAGLKFLVFLKINLKIRNPQLVIFAWYNVY